MSEADDVRPCPACGRFVASQYCPHCGAKVVFAGPLPVLSDDAPTIPSLPAVGRGEAPAAAVPEMFPTEMVPTAGSTGSPQAWSEASEPAAGPPAGLFPGWTGVYPAVATEGAGGALAPRPERRRRAIYAVLGIAAATVVVLVAALLIAPHLGTSRGTAQKDGQPVAVSSIGASPTSAPPSSTVGSAASSAPEVPVASPSAGTTVTVTAPSGTTGAPRTTAPAKTPPKSTAKPAPKTTAKPAPKTKVKPTPKTTPKPTPVTYPLGVPEREITCNPGFVVQLASELDAAAFTAHVSRLKAAGRLPAGSLVADSAKSCKIFTSQVNTLVLYAGPFAGPYDGCAARLAGPADAYIKGSNPANSQQYVSCLCPANTTALPQYSKVGSQGVWVGEAQRVFGNKLNIDVRGLSKNWGIFTAETKAAVREFQRSANLPTAGNLDPSTWKALQSAEC